MNDTNKRVGLIGLGAMGAPMARQIVQKDVQLTVFGVNPAAVHALSAAGAKAVASPKDVSEQSDVVITMLPHPDVLRDVVFGKDDLMVTAPVQSRAPAHVPLAPPSVRRCRAGCRHVFAHGDHHCRADRAGYDMPRAPSAMLA